MQTIFKPILLASSIGLANLALLSNALAVGAGVSFSVDESTVPAALANAFQADSMDFTYHACTQVNILTGDLEETGYFWVSSYQDVDSVVDSQINHFRPNGYHIYGKYQFKAHRLGIHPDFLNPRTDYQVENGVVQLFLDPDQNTQLAIANCQVTRMGASNDTVIGSSNTFEVGEKSEKVDLANGDFELRFTNWMWGNANPIVPFPSAHFVFNANVTRLNQQLLFSHKPEGSGNLYWLAD